MAEISSATNTNPSKDVSDSVKKNLFTMAMESRWEKVVIEYKKADKLAHKAKITSFNGNVRMCKCIAKSPSLVGIPNKDKETPLFLAALHGKKDAFLCLHYICTPDESQQIFYSYCRREDGDTILHCAIAGDYFDLAFQIIALYKNLVNYVNEVGFTPLHLLASKASAFKSGSHLRSGIIIIYHCIYVDELKVEQADHFQKRVINPIKEERDPEYPENYKTCINIMRVFRDIAKAVFAIAGSYSNEEMDSRKKPTDAENPKEVDGRKRSTDAENPKASHKLPKVSLQVHYKFCFDFVKLLSKAMLIVLGLGFTGIKKMRDKKKSTYGLFRSWTNC
ncbi:hypothetical protein M0R45_010762 [Rubus argutus]|uniref:Uncharacterized protein n=1 Tax=Rubus argutus TaxID=59490 RepID=A0AAW1Y8U2_RUBAR